MRKLSVLVLVLITALVPLVTRAQDVGGGDLEEIASSVVMIETLRGQRAIGSGTGTIISEGGRIYTNQHVIDGGNDFAIFMLAEDLGEQPDLRYYASLEYISDDLDFAILQIDRDSNGNRIDPTQERLPFLSPTHADEVSIGDTIRIYGYPGIGDGYMIITSGEIVAVQNGTVAGERLPVWYRTDAEISGGNSGGLAVNESGEFIGLPTWVVAEERTAGRLGGILPIGAIELSLRADPPSSNSVPQAANGNTAGSLTVFNDSIADICSAYISPTTADSWGENQLGTAQIPGGDTFAWDFPAGAYDVLLIGCDGRTLEDFRNITVRGSTLFTYLPDGNSSFEAFDGDAPAAPGVASLTVVNNSILPICFVYISPTTASTWGDDQLNNTEIIDRGDGRTFEVEPNTYDVLLQGCDGDDLSDTRGVEVNGPTELAYP